MCAQSLRHAHLLGTPWTVARQTPLSMGFSRRKYWSELPFPPPNDLPNPGIKSMSSASPVLAGRFFTSELPGKPHNKAHTYIISSHYTNCTTKTMGLIKIQLVTTFKNFLHDIKIETE